MSLAVLHVQCPEFVKVSTAYLYLQSMFHRRCGFLKVGPDSPNTCSPYEALLSKAVYIAELPSLASLVGGVPDTSTTRDQMIVRYAARARRSGQRCCFTLVLVAWMSWSEVSVLRAGGCRRRRIGSSEKG